MRSASRTPARIPWLSIATLSLLILPGAARAQQRPAPAPATDWSQIERVLGRAPSESNGVRKLVFPRTDIRAFVRRTPLNPGAAMASWMAFREATPDATPTVVTTGDLVLLPQETPAVMDALLHHGFEVTGLHNHLMGEHPELMYLHFFARGELGALLQGLKAALHSTATPMRPHPPSGQIVDRKRIEEVFGKPGTASGDVLSFSFPQEHQIIVHGITLPAAMGMATAINFQPAPPGVAATGDFVLEEREVTPVLAALRKDGITVTAIHNHLLDETPRMVFVHFWVEGRPEAVARALLEAVRLQK